MMSGVIEKPPQRMQESPEFSEAGERAFVRKWTQVSRLINLSLAPRDNPDPPRAQPFEPPVGKVRRDRWLRETVLTIVLTLLMLAGAAWFGGLW